MNFEAITSPRRPGARTVVAALVVAGLSLGCASTDQEIEALQRAEAQFNDARTAARIDEFASRNMQEAQRNLRRAQSLAEEGGDMDAIEHHAFLAEHQVEIAEARLNRGLVQEQIGNADQRRQELLLAMEQRDARRSQERAGQAQQRAEEAEARLALTEEELQKTQEAATTLAQELDELKVKQDERGTVLTLSDVVFDLNSDELNQGGERSVERIADTLKQHPDGEIVIEGYTDSTGSESYNEDLSERRAQAVKQVFVKQGVPEQRLKVKGYGEQYPAATNDTPQGRQLNRRVEIVVRPEGQTDQRETAQRQESSRG